MSGRSPRQLHLNINALHSGFVPSAWRLDDADPRAFIDISHYVRLAQIAERRHCARLRRTGPRQSELVLQGHCAIPVRAQRHAREHAGRSDRQIDTDGAFWNRDIGPAQADGEITIRLLRKQACVDVGQSLTPAIRNRTVK